MLRTFPEISTVFICADGTDKEIYFIRVDGGGDENSSHIENKFHWTEFHIHHAKVATILTIYIYIYSEGSFLNDVEHMNGQLTWAATNPLFHQLYKDKTKIQAQGRPMMNY
jgi:hypothetical protein